MFYAVFNLVWFGVFMKFSNELYNFCVEKLNIFSLKHGFEILERSNIVQEGWFIGSALQTINLDAIFNGYKAAGSINTIWTRHLNVLPPNFYWEIHNQLYQLLYVGNYSCFDLLGNFLDFLLDIFSLDKSNIFVVTDAPKSTLPNVNLIKGNLPFSINGKEIGKYSKFFIYRNNRLYPLFDSVLFEYNGKQVLELHINISHLLVGVGYAPNIYMCPTKIDIYNEVSNKVGLCEIDLDYVYDIQLLGLWDALRAFDDHCAYPGNNKFGHTVKRVLKMVGKNLYRKGLRYPCIIEDVHEKIVSVVNAEIKKIEYLNPSKFKEYDTKYLKETYGIDQEDLVLASGEYTSPRIDERLGKMPSYFTDLPFFEIADHAVIEEYMQSIMESKYKK